MTDPATEKPIAILPDTPCEVNFVHRVQEGVVAADGLTVDLIGPALSLHGQRLPPGTRIRFELSGFVCSHTPEEQVGPAELGVGMLDARANDVDLPSEAAT